MSSNQDSVAVAHDLESPSSFEYIEKGFPLLQSTDAKQKLLQWNLDRSLQIFRFCVNKKITKETEEETIQAFFRDPNVQSHLKLPRQLDNIRDLHCRRLRCTITSLSFFDKLVDAGLVASSGSLRRCMDEVYDGATAGDLVKEALINPDSENADVFSEEEQNEFIFQIFRALVLGGSMCQSDDNIAPYESMTKQFYKSLVSVKKNTADPTAIDITSHVYVVEDDALFASPSPFHTCFVVFDPKKRWLTVWRHAFEPFW
ncbi:hypothetical protein Poli38472_003615 [Pythium oligandrum]|uniref:Cilia- and flagella-associated protein 300 n=1 Tax=Pythium oligandrum TaxID=41045 RepID=A0A8K1FJ99_PYTOL|nr:hypothetical protein Poli38472_003615 [Pythium oligandrum]|eukprot:TMW65850.1 hypothetical protein Poli38472_003615 [Pythium oligandrum]